MNLFSIANLPFAKQDEAWREQMKATRQELEANVEDTIASLGTATSSQILGTGDLAAKAAVKRIQNETNAKIEANQKAANKYSVWTNKPPANSVTAGDSTIDFLGNTVTLSDGTQIDLKTGLKVADTANTMTLGDGSVLNLDTGQIVNITA